jgi:hypothetical protein
MTKHTAYNHPRLKVEGTAGPTEPLLATSRAFLAPRPQRPPEIDPELELVSAHPSANRPHAPTGIVSSSARRELASPPPATLSVRPLPQLAQPPPASIFEDLGGHGDTVKDLKKAKSAAQNVLKGPRNNLMNVSTDLTLIRSSGFSCPHL